MLRDELGFDGVIVSDALDMAGASAETGIPEAAVRALAAGVDLLCLGSATDEERYVAVHAAVVRGGGLGPAAASERVAEAAGRVRALAAARRRTPARRPADVVRGGRRGAAPSRISDAARPGSASPAPLAVVQVGSTANLAVGGSSRGARPPWARPCRGRAVPAGAKVAVVGRAVGADHPARATADRLRAAGHDVVLVECGWPRGGADVETYGGSPVVARALLAVLRGEVGLP